MQCAARASSGARTKTQLTHEPGRERIQELADPFTVADHRTEDFAMAKRAIIRIGDRTSHGGTVVSADPSYRIYGRNVARVGDQVNCPRCKGVFPIVTGALTVTSRQPIARHDDVTSCGAKLIASQILATVEDTYQAKASTAHQASAGSQDLAPARGEKAIHRIRFRALDPVTGAATPGCIYILTRGDGLQHGGATDSDGFTEIVETTQRESIGIHFIFQSPRGHSIEQKEVSP